MQQYRKRTQHGTCDVKYTFHFFLFFVFFLSWIYVYCFFGTHFNIEQAKGRTEKPCSLTRLSYCCFRDCFRDYVWMKVWWMTSGKKLIPFIKGRLFPVQRWRWVWACASLSNKAFATDSTHFCVTPGKVTSAGAEILTYTLLEAQFAAVLQSKGL